MSQYDDFYNGIPPGQSESQGQGQVYIVKSREGGEDEFHFIPDEEIQAFATGRGEDEYDDAEDIPSAAAGGGGYEGGYADEEIKIEIEYDFAFLASMHSLIDDVHRSNSVTNNTKFQMSSIFNKPGFLPPPGTFQTLIANPIGNKTTLDMLKIQLRELEIEVHKKDKYGTIVFKNLIDPNKIAPHNTPDIPEHFMYYIPHLFDIILLMNNKVSKKDRTKFFIKELQTYSEQLYIWCPNDDREISEHINNIFREIETYVKKSEIQKQLPNVNAPIVYSDLPDLFKKGLKDRLVTLLTVFNKYNNEYVTGLYQNLRHRTVSGNEEVGLPRYNFEGNHEGDTETHTGFSLIIYENTFLNALWEEYCKETGVRPGFEKTQDGAILRMDPPSPMYMFLRWCGHFLDDEVDAKSAYIIFLKMLSVDYTTNLISEYGYVTTDELLYFIHLLKKIISKHFAHDINKLNVYCYMFGCGNFDYDKEEELTKIFENIEYDPTQTPDVEINTITASQTGLQKVVEAFTSGAMPNADADQNNTVLTLANAIITKNENPGFSQSVLSQEANELQYNEGQNDALTQISQILSQAATAGGGGRVFGGRKTRRNKKPRQKTRRSRKTR